MTYWCDRWQPNDGNAGCEIFTEHTEGTRTLNAEGETLDNVEDGNGEITCDNHDRTAEWFGRHERNLLEAARDRAYIDADWAYCDNCGEWEETLCGADNEDQDEENPDRTPIQTANGTFVIWNAATKAYTKIRPPAATIRGTWENTP